MSYDCSGGESVLFTPKSSDFEVDGFFICVHAKSWNDLFLPSNLCILKIKLFVFALETVSTSFLEGLFVETETSTSNLAADSAITS